MHIAFRPDGNGQAVALTTHRRAVGMRRPRVFIVDGGGLVTAVAIRTSRRIIESGNEQRLAMLACQISFQDLRRRLMACAAGMNLVDLRDGRCGIATGNNGVHTLVAIDATRLIRMHAAANRSVRFAVAFSANGSIGRGNLMRRPMTIAAGQFAMHTRAKRGGRIMALQAILVCRELVEVFRSMRLFGRVGVAVDAFESRMSSRADMD